MRASKRIASVCLCILLAIALVPGAAFGVLTSAVDEHEWHLLRPVPTDGSEITVYCAIHSGETLTNHVRYQVEGDVTASEITRGMKAEVNRRQSIAALAAAGIVVDLQITGDTRLYIDGDLSVGSIAQVGDGERSFEVTGDGVGELKVASDGLRLRGALSVKSGRLVVAGGIVAEGPITVEGGTVKVTASMGTALHSEKRVALTGGTVAATGFARGIFGRNGVTVSGADVTANAEPADSGRADEFFAGIGSDGFISVLDGSVTSAAGTMGLSAYGPITISGGSVSVGDERSTAPAVFSRTSVTVTDPARVVMPPGAVQVSARSIAGSDSVVSEGYSLGVDGEPAGHVETGLKPSSDGGAGAGDNGTDPSSDGDGDGANGTGAGTGDGAGTDGAGTGTGAGTDGDVSGEAGGAGDSGSDVEAGGDGGSGNSGIGAAGEESNSGGTGSNSVTNPDDGSNAGSGSGGNGSGASGNQTGIGGNGDGVGVGAMNGVNGIDGASGANGVNGADARAGLLVASETAALTTGEADGSGALFNKLRVKGKKSTKTTVKLTWRKVSGATSYVVFGTKCGKANRYQLLETVAGASFTDRGLKKGTYYRYFVIAMKGDKILTQSKTVHVATAGGKVTNYKKVTLPTAKLMLSKGSTYALAPVTTQEKTALKVKVHKGFRYESSNKKVAKVSKSGKITAKGSGSCYVYAYVQNGVYARVKIVVP